MSKSISPDLRGQLLKVIANTGLPLGHCFLVTVARDDLVESHGDVGLRGRALDRARAVAMLETARASS